MKVKARNLIELILQVACLVCLFLTPFFESTFLRCYYNPNPPIFSPQPTYIHEPHPVPCSVFGLFLKRDYSSWPDALPSWFTMLFIFGMISLCVIGLVLFLLQFISQGDKRNSRLVLFPLVAQALLLSSFSAAVLVRGHDYVWIPYDVLLAEIGTSSAGKASQNFLEFSTFYWVFLVLFVILFAITFIGYFLAKKRGIVDETSPKAIVATVSSADELKKYKELLDSGIISESEFEEKKKSILTK